MLEPLDIPPNLLSGGELDGTIAPGPGPLSTLTLSYVRDVDSQLFEQSAVVTPPLSTYPFWHLAESGARVVIQQRLDALGRDVG